MGMFPAGARWEGTVRKLVLLLVVVAGWGCGGASVEQGGEQGQEPQGHSHEDSHMATGATCPPDSTLTYASFGADFMGRFCTRCHSGDPSVAPKGLRFESVEAIRAAAHRIDAHAASGPQGTKAAMPPAGNPAPTQEERARLGEWLACGAP
jgi:hypothetical protein